MHFKPIFISFVLFLSTISLLSAFPTYHELFRPSYHFTPPKNWMNDPNGLIYANGEYHLYYQHNPYDIIWAHMSWGHAVSKDLIYWENLPVAIWETPEFQIYSGSTIIDFNNTSGLCEKPGCMLAFFTSQYKDREAQSVAYSNDNGRTFTQYTGNPLIDEKLVDHRDPKVFWYEPHQKWIMVTALSWDFKIRMYSSKDLLNWEFMSDFGPDGLTEGVWEDPDLFLLEVEGEDNKKWVLSHAVDVTKVEYYIGEFDGYKFTNTETNGKIVLVDYGTDFDEAATFNNEPKGRRLIIGWLDEGIYGLKTPTKEWRGMQSLIRELKIRRYPEGLRLVSGPIEEYQKLRDQHKHSKDIHLNRIFHSHKLVKGGSLEILAKFEYKPDDNSQPSEFGFKIFSGKDQETIIGYDVENQQLFVDRTKSGIVDFDPIFASVTKALYTADDGKLQLQLFIDHSSVEIFADYGKIAMSSLIFPDPKKDQVVIYVKGGSVKVTSVDSWVLKDIWPDDSPQDMSFISD